MSKFTRLFKLANAARLATYLIALWKLFKHPETPRTAKLVAIAVIAGGAVAGAGGVAADGDGVGCAAATAVGGAAGVGSARSLVAQAARSRAMAMPNGRVMAG